MVTFVFLYVFIASCSSIWLAKPCRVYLDTGGKTLFFFSFLKYWISYLETSSEWFAASLTDSHCLPRHACIRALKVLSFLLRKLVFVLSAVNRDRIVDPASHAARPSKQKQSPHPLCRQGDWWWDREHRRGAGAPSWWGTVTPTGGKCGAHSPADVLQRDINVRGGLTSVPEASRPFFARSSSGVPPTPPCAAPTAPQDAGCWCRRVKQGPPPLLAHSVCGVERGGALRKGAGPDTWAERARRPASVLWPSRTSECWGWSFTRENDVITWIPVHSAPAFHALRVSSLFTRTFWGTAWFLEWLSLVCERSCMCLNGVNSCCTYVWGEMAWLAARVAWRGTSFSWGAPSTGSCKVLQRKQFWLKEITEKKCFREATVKPSVYCCSWYLDIKRIFVNESVFESKHSKNTFPS